MAYNVHLVIFSENGPVPVPQIAIVGRPNVGKSSLFNWLAGRRIAIVDPAPGVTRDRLAAPINVGSRYLEIIDTGGMGIDGCKEPLRLAGLLDVSFVLPESDVHFEAKARLMWVGDEGRVGIRFSVIEPALFEQLQHWTNRKMKDEGWDFPA